MDRIAEIEALQRACNCLYIAVDATIADDVKAKADAVIDLVRRQRECLAVFAKAAGQVPAEAADAMPIRGLAVDTFLTVGDLRKARALIDPAADAASRRG